MYRVVIFDENGNTIYSQQFHHIEISRIVKELNGAYYVTVEKPKDEKEAE